MKENNITTAAENTTTAAENTTNTPAVENHPAVKATVNAPATITAKLDAIGSVSAVSHKTYKSAALTKYAARLDNAVVASGAKSREAAAVLYLIDRTKSFTDDGYKSLADFAESAGYYEGDKSAVYKLAKAGRLLMNDSEAISNFAKSAAVTVLSILATLDDTDIEKGLKEGALKPTMKAKDASDFTKKAKEAKEAASDKVKVMPTYDFTLVYYGPKGTTTIKRDNYTLDGLPEAEEYNFKKAASPAGLDEAYVGYYVGTPKSISSFGIFTAVAKRHVVAKSEASKKKASLPDIDLSNMTPEQLAAIAAAIKAAQEAKK